jgi:hypothetical protein
MRQPGSGALEVTWVWDLMDTAGVPNQTFAILSPNKLSRSSTGQGSSLVAGEDKEAEETTYRDEFLALAADSEISVNACYRLEVNWLVASGKTVLEFVQNLYKRANKHALRLVQVPEYTTSLNLSIHSFLGAPFLALPAEIMPVLELSLLQKFGFIADRERPTDWNVTVPWMHPTAAKGAHCSRGYGPQRGARGDPQYIHNTGGVAVRVYPQHGFAFVTNRLQDHRTTSNSLGKDLFHSIEAFSSLLQRVSGCLRRLSAQPIDRSLILWAIVQFL